MPFIPGRCSQCNGEIVQKADGSFKCDNCGTPFYFDKITNKYVTKIENLHTDKVVVNDDRSAEKRLAAAETFMQIKLWKEAEQAYYDACKLAPQDYRCWWGRIRAYTMEFSKHQNLSDSDIFPLKPLQKEIAQLDEYYAIVRKFAPTNIRDEIASAYEDYTAPLNAIIKNESKAASIMQAEIDKLDSEEDDIRKLQEQHRHHYYIWFSRYKGAFWIYLIIFIIFGIMAKKAESSTIPVIVIVIAIASLVIVAIRDLICLFINATNDSALKWDSHRLDELRHTRLIISQAQLKLEEDPPHHLFSKESTDYLSEVMYLNDE